VGSGCNCINRNNSDILLAAESAADQISRLSLAINLARIGARPQLITAETGFSKSIARKIYFDSTGKRPPKGQLPNSPDEFVKLWRLNIDASLFINIHRNIISNSQVTQIDALIKSYKLYLEHVHLRDTPRELSFNRAWTLLRLIDAGLLVMTKCTKCGGKFVAHPSVLSNRFFCVFCRQPTGRQRIIHDHTSRIHL
jgi:flagellar transcriptional activator FlhC